MKARAMLSLVAVACAFVVGAAIAADEKEPGKEVKCPVSSKPVNPEAIVEFEECKVYFCCNNCPKAFEKDTAKFAAKAHHQMVQTEQLKQVACPLTGRPMNPSTEIEVADVKVVFCCNNCKGKAEKAEGDEQINLIFKDTKKGFKLAKEEKEK